MSGRGNSMRRLGARLFLAYAIASLVPVLVLGGVLLHGYRQDALERGVQQGASQATVIEEMAISPALDGESLDDGLSYHGLSRLQSATGLAIFKGSVLRLRLRSFSGRVVFSDDGSTAGALPTRDHAFVNAERGRSSTAIVTDSSIAPGRLIRVLRPVVADVTGQAQGIVEVYLPYGPIEASSQAALHRTYVRLSAGLVALYVVLGLISWSTTRRLRRLAVQREHQALHDELTGLPNREWYRMHAEDALREEDARGAVVLVDLDRFKSVNDTHGHHTGDELLRTVAQRLQAQLRTDDMVARLGGDEFGLFLPGVGAVEAVELVQRVRAEMQRELSLGGIALDVGASFGLACFPEHGTSLEQLLQRADAAMYQGKRGVESVVVYGQLVGPAELTAQDELAHALVDDQLVLHYQPKVHLGTGTVVGAEALVRWQHPTRGLLGPYDFLPALEQSALIEPFTAWVLRRALTDQARWTELGHDWSVAVNVSARNLDEPGFASTVTGLLSELGVRPDRLHIEVTETALAADAENAAAVLVDLSRAGLAVAIDDFGTGFTALSQLRHAPVAEVKIDRTFVTGLADSPEDQAIVGSVVQLARGLGCRVTAEGVETREAHRWLLASGCDYAQGFLYSRPVPWTELVSQHVPVPDVGHPSTVTVLVPAARTSEAAATASMEGTR